MQNNDKDFKEYIETLPPELKQAIYSIDYPKKLQEIVKNNKLMIDQAGKLEAETTLVMAGIEPLDKFVRNLIDNVGLSNIQASVVAHDVNELIFKNIRESLKKINEQILEEDRIAEQKENPTKEDLLAGIEHPENIKIKESSVSISSLKSNSTNPETHEEIDRGVEIKINPHTFPFSIEPHEKDLSNTYSFPQQSHEVFREGVGINNLPEIAPEAMLPAVSALNSKQAEPFHQNIPPVKNIVESKMANTVVVPKQTIIVEEKTKLPEKPKPTGDPYREPII